jgi:hypothetical protein
MKVGKEGSLCGLILRELGIITYLISEIKKKEKKREERKKIIPSQHKALSKQYKKRTSGILRD